MLVFILSYIFLTVTEFIRHLQPRVQSGFRFDGSSLLIYVVSLQAAGYFHSRSKPYIRY